MSSVSWILWVAGAAASFALALWFYRTRETPGRGRAALAVLRGAVIAVLLLLVLNPRLPGTVRTDAPAVLVDASLSMALPGGQASLTRWSEAIDQARQLGGDRVLTFGDVARPAIVDSLPAMSPAATRSRLLPALQAVAEAGQRRVTVITDRALEDADEVARWLPRLGLELDVVATGRSGTNRGLARVSAPSWVETGEPLDIQFEVSAIGSAGAPVVVQARSGDRVLAETTVETPAEGRVATGTLRFAAVAPSTGEFARFDVTLQGGDVMADDDARSVYVRVSAEPAGALLISLLPDWEPRHLFPVLGRSLGMPVRGYLRAGDGWVGLGSGLDVGRRATDEQVQNLIARAELLVVHGLSARSPSWVRNAVRTARRVLVLPSGDGQVPGLTLPPTGAIAADWYLSDEIPPSPVAPLLAGLDVRDVPPLMALRIPGRVAGTWSPALVNRGRRGAAYAIAMGGTTGNRRWVVALGEGYWRWAFWSDASRHIYDRLWSALAGWLVEESLASGPDALVPADRVVARGAPLRWVAGGLGPDSMHVRVLEGDSVRVDAMLAAAGADTLSTRPLAPGHYTYALRAFAGEDIVEGEGELTVESWSEDFTRPAVNQALLEAAPTALSGPASARTPLHASAWPWALLVVLLCAEWVLRRRWGLR